MIKARGTAITATLLAAAILVLTGCSGAAGSPGETSSATTTSSGVTGISPSLSEVALEIPTIS